MRHSTVIPADVARAKKTFLSDGLVARVVRPFCETAAQRPAPSRRAHPPCRWGAPPAEKLGADQQDNLGVKQIGPMGRPAGRTHRTTHGATFECDPWVRPRFLTHGFDLRFRLMVSNRGCHRFDVWMRPIGVTHRLSHGVNA